MQKPFTIVFMEVSLLGISVMLDYYGQFQFEIALILITLGILGPIYLYRHELKDKFLSKQGSSDGQYDSTKPVRSEPNEIIRPSPNHVPKPDVDIPIDRDRVYSARTIEEISNAIDGLNSLQTNRFIQPFIGKWIRVQGTIKDIFEYSTESNEIGVLLGQNQEKSLTSPTLILTFVKETWLPTLETMNSGDFAHVEGEIDKISKFRISIKNCEII